MSTEFTSRALVWQNSNFEEARNTKECMKYRERTQGKTFTVRDALITFPHW